MARCLRFGSLVELYDLPGGRSDGGAKNGDRGQLLGYTRATDAFDVMMIGGHLEQFPSQHVRVPKDVKKSGSDEFGFDMLVGPKTLDLVLAEEMATCIFEKGFCVLKMCSGCAEDVERTLEAVREAGDEGRLGRLPQEVEEGYLGIGGKGKIVWLDPDQPDKLTDEVLDMNDRNFSHLAAILQPFSEDALGKCIEERTPALVSLTLQEGEEDDYPFPMADDKTLGDFLGTWRRGLLRAVHFMGPAACDVLLESKDGPKSTALPSRQDSVGIMAEPNTVLLFRPDCYSYSCSSEAEVLTMATSFLSVAPHFVLSGWEGDTELLSAVTGGPPPPSWNEHINVMNCNTRLGACWDEPEMMAAGLQGGCDTVVEIPYSRFDVNFYFCDEPDEVLFGPPRTIQRHTSFVDAIDLFDNKYFEITTNEATGMDPLQRQVLEVGGACLYQQGITKKVSNRSSHHAGCSVGLDKADFPSLGVDTGGSAGNNALAIIANRFSFTFNMKGPNYVCDTACSASLTATHLAKLMLLERVWDPLEFHIAIGTHLCLAPGPWIGCSMSHMVSPQGRCFTFNATANGYLRGEGTSGQFLKFGPDEKEKDAIYRASQCGQDGRSASLTAPNGPAQEEIINKAIREANMTPPESTVWECHGTGTSLGDPIEVGAIRKVQIKHERPEPLMMTTNKSNVGHLEGGAAMAGMVKCVQTVIHTQCFAALHLNQLNPHLEHSTFDAFMETEASAFPYEQGHCHVSSFGFGGTNGHVIYWGRNQARQAGTVKERILRRMSKMAPPEVRPVGDNPDEWESDLPDADLKPGDTFVITFSSEDPPDAPIKWRRKETALEPVEDDDDAFFSITGNFNGWEEDRMAPGDVPGQNVTTLTVPSGGVLEFRFLKDGDSEKVICPEVPDCSRKCAPIIGPEAGLTNSWVVKEEEDAEVQVEILSLKGRYSVLWFKL
uniref:Type I polyketide synthase n=1 Tax=Gambierdiscus excentricus TaxID=986170 RepID=A0A1S6K7X3_9DINO|nr:type I polyketide synthase [Gambierdiscus excentricus]